MTGELAFRRRRRTIIYRLLSVFLVGQLLVACAGASQPAQPNGDISVAQAAGGVGKTGFARVLKPREFSFPQDHGPHQEYAIEWWYYTGNLDTGQGRHFGFQLTFFRIGMAPKLPERSSDWATSNIFMAHFALTDIVSQKFYAFERFSRGAAGLAGAQGQPFRVWLEDWSAASAGADALPMRIQAAQDDVAIDLTLASSKPVVLQGEGGVSQTGSGSGKAYYYYSLTRMPTQGAVTVAGQRYDVRGSSWMDHEFGTDALDANAVGWDWFALQLDDGRELMYARLRAADGRTGALNMLVEADGSTRALPSDSVAIDTLGEWQSARSGGRYPAGWRLRIPASGLDLTISPYLADQELSLTTTYWEGAVKITGTAAGKPIGGSGYVELTGYAERQNDLRVR
jgi:predicted secreted hydrolase